MLGPAPPTVAAPGSFRVGSLAGVPIRLSFTTLVLVALLMVALVPPVDRVRPDLGAIAYLVGALIGVTVYLAVLLHELAHAVVARRYGHHVESITLSLIGGRTAVHGEAASPREEFVTAVVGPVVSLVVGGLALLLRVSVAPGLLSVALEVIVLANLVLGLLDLVPAPPMDGGRLVKAAGWRLTGSPRRGAVVAARSGQVVAVLVLVVTVLVVPVVLDDPRTSDTVLGVAVALLLWTMASSELNVARLRLEVGSVVVRDLARRPLTVAPDLPLAEALRRSREAQAPGLVTTDAHGGLLGVVSEAAVAEVPEDRRPWVPVSDVARAIKAEHRLPADVTGDELLAAINRSPVAEYLLLDQAGSLVGVLSLSDLDRLVRPAGRRRPR